MTTSRLRAAGLGALAALLALAIFVARRSGDDSPLRRATPDEAALLVTVRGVGFCSGAPVEGTRMVVTAAHCLLDPHTGTVSTRHDLRVERDGIRYDIETVIVDPASTVSTVIPARDAAVLVLTTPVSGPGVQFPRIVNDSAGSHLTDTSVLIIGNQPVDATGSFHRGRNYRDRAPVAGASPGAVYVGHVATTCAADTVGTGKHLLTYRCGMVPGGSGGPVIARGGNTLVGVVSSVNYNLTRNGVVPVNEILRILRHADRFTVNLRDLVTTAGNEYRRL